MNATHSQSANKGRILLRRCGGRIGLIAGFMATGYLMLSHAPEAASSSVVPRSTMVQSMVPQPPGQTISADTLDDRPQARLNEPIPDDADLVATDEEVKGLEEKRLDSDAIASLKASLYAGDPRAPAIGAGPQAPMPTREQLATPEAYQSFLAGQRQGLLRRFAYAVPAKVKQLEEAIARAEAAGMDSAEIAFARDKIARLHAMQRRVTTEADTLLLSHPELEPPTP